MIHEKLLNLATPSFSSKNPTGPWFPWRSCQSEKLILLCLLRGRGRLRTRLARFLFGLAALLSNPVAQLRLGAEGERPPCSASSVNASGCVWRSSCNDGWSQCCPDLSLPTCSPHHTSFNQKLHSKDTTGGTRGKKCRCTARGKNDLL